MEARQLASIPIKGLKDEREMGKMRACIEPSFRSQPITAIMHFCVRGKMSFSAISCNINEMKDYILVQKMHNLLDSLRLLSLLHEGLN
jgi:hypothetical protein